MQTNALAQQVGRARRRLWLNRWLRQLGWMLTFGAAIFVTVVIVERLFQFGLPLRGMAWGLMGLALLGSFVWLAIRHESRLAAAEALDEAAGLRERVTSGLYCADSNEAFARSVYADAVRTIRRITVGRHLAVRYPRSLNWAAGSAVAALLVLWLMPSYDLLGLFAREQEAEKKIRALKTTQAAVRQVAQRVKQLAETSKALQDIEGLEGLAELDAAQPVEADQLKRDAVKKLDRLSDRLKRQQASAQYDELEEFKKMLRRLGAPPHAETPVDRLRQGLAKGDFKAAAKALGELREQLAKAKTPGDKARIAAMQAQIARLAAQLEKLAGQKRLEGEMRRAGLSEKDIKKLLENLSKRDLASIKKALEKKGLSKQQVKKMMRQIAKSQAAGAKCKGLAGCLGAAAQAMQGSGDLESGEAASALSRAGEQLSAMEMLEQEMNDLEATLSELADARAGLCDGPGEYGLGKEGGKGAGMGEMGQGRGGRAPRKETSVKYKPDRVKGRQSPGAMVGEMFVEGEQLKGQASEKAVEAVGAAVREAAEAMDRDRVPRQYHKPLKKYFGKIQEGLGKPKPAKKP